jgi:predicted RNase H-like nuclease
VFEHITEVLDYRPRFDAVALLSPTAFRDDPAGPYRPCDVEARDALGWPRRNAIGPVPSRAALHASTSAEALRIEPWLTPGDLRRFRWLREAETEIAAYHQRAVYSCHPELSYAVLNEDRPLRSSPYSVEGTNERVNLARVRLPGIDAAVLGTPPRGAATYHLVQAAGLLWSARRIAGRVVNRYPLDPMWDDVGRRMEIVR